MLGVRCGGRRKGGGGVNQHLQLSPSPSLSHFWPPPSLSLRGSESKQARDTVAPNGRNGRRRRQVHSRPNSKIVTYDARKECFTVFLRKKLASLSPSLSSHFLLLLLLLLLLSQAQETISYYGRTRREKTEEEKEGGGATDSAWTLT